METYKIFKHRIFKKYKKPTRGYQLNKKIQPTMAYFCVYSAESKYLSENQLDKYKLNLRRHIKKKTSRTRFHTDEFEFVQYTSKKGYKPRGKGKSKEFTPLIHVKENQMSFNVRSKTNIYKKLQTVQTYIPFKYKAIFYKNFLLPSQYDDQRKALEKYIKFIK